jgi:hypothetical protein
MRRFTTVLMLAAMATAALAQDPNPNGNRMNDLQFRQAQPQESTARPLALSALPDPFANRMNVAYGTAGGTSLSGGPNPYGNRMNFEWPKTRTPEPVVEPPPVRPEPTP